MRTYTVIAVNPLEQCSRDDKPAGMLFQYDYGQRLVFGGVDLPSAYEVHFSNDREGESVTVIGDITGVDIPDSLLLTGQDIHVWLYLHQGEDDGETVYYARIAVRTRATPTHEEPTPVQQDEITQAIAALNAAVESTEADAAAAEASASAASAAQAAAEAAQDGAESAMSAAEAAQTGAETAEEAAEDAQAAAERARDEITGMTAEATTLDPGESATASYEDGVLTIGVPRGADGQDGDPGADGYSPAASVSKSGTTATITITDKNGTTTAEVSDGEDGAPGADGISPTASVSKSGTTATITITDRDGTTTATVTDGTDGQDGQDGYTPVRGTDYWTNADQAAIVADVEAEIAPEISALKSALNGKAPVIERAVSGDIASFSDGADGMPLTAVVSVEPVQSGTGDPSPTNVRPISGWTGCNVSRTGINIWDEQWEVGGISSSDGQNVVDPQRIRSKNYIPVKPGVQLYIKSPNQGATAAGNLAGRYYDQDRNFLGYSPTMNVGQIITIPGNCYYIRFNTQSAYGTTYNNDISINYPATDTDYHAYIGSVYPITWQSAAGTVYGGNLDTGSGVLTVDRKMVTLNGGEDWQITGQVLYLDIEHDYLKTYTEYIPISNRLKGIVQQANTSAMSGVQDDNVITLYGGAANYWRIFVKKTDLQTVDAFKGWLLSNNVQFCYKLATPVTYQLDPVQITTLMGENHIWSDTGAISVTYPADTQTYVDSAISAATDPDGNVVQVTGSTPSITGESGKRYVCGTVDSISITPPQTGIVDVVFTSGTTPTVLTVPNTVLFPGWFNPSNLSANSTYEINIMDGVYGAVSVWS